MRLFLLVVLSVTSAAAQQTIQQTIEVGNAASGSGVVAPGSIVAVNQLTPRIVNPDPSRVTVSIHRSPGATAAFTAPLVSAPFLSIWALLPADLPLGIWYVVLTVDGVTSAPA